MKRKIIVGLMLTLPIVLIGSFFVWNNPSVQKELLRQYLGRLIVSKINHRANPTASKWNMDIYAVNSYPKIRVKMKLRGEGRNPVSAAQLQQQSCIFLKNFQTLKQSTRTKVYGLLIEDRLSFEIEIFNMSGQKIQSTQQVLAQCPNFPYA
ncbi:MAG: hypothetical protein LBQ29_13895 [Acinetobacter sp.]|jgi:hypothetical protein|uniref:hypothetical protein n=1 Tax=Acinetobacter sp. TaxID=472 RepID=UPI00281F47BA|nr:hypothetical protein [Acinetobacter sp.]MDR2062483.1 hypothetical protein [Acinetobacter sp.]